jgi:hypothetical protein
MDRDSDSRSILFSKRPEPWSKTVQIGFNVINSDGLDAGITFLLAHLERDALTKTFAEKGLPRQVLFLCSEVSIQMLQRQGVDFLMKATVPREDCGMAHFSECQLPFFWSKNGLGTLHPNA